MTKSIDDLKEVSRKNLLSHGKELDEETLDAIAELWEISPRLARQIEKGVCEMTLTIQGGTHNFDNVTF